MSQTIDQRIVEMRFDNAQFENGVQTSLKTLDRLKNATNLDGKAFSGIDKAANNISLSGISGAIETVSSRFSALEAIGVGALMRIGSQAVDAGEKLIKSLSVDNIAAGWEKFGEKTTSVGTLLAQGFKMEDVENVMDRLNWFTDETSYNLTDMIGNISKFTATGKNLDDSATAMQGIALWAALSGQNATTASRAMYQLSQAMSVGALRQEDFKSIQNASMDTKEFREQALKAAVALGKVKKEGEGLYKVGNKEFTFAEMFTSDALTRTGWLDADVMMSTFKSYSSAVDSIYEAVQAGDFDTASEAIAKLGGELDAFGVKAFKAGQEARTWRDVLDSVKDAVSTGWMKTFELIFGNYQEATKLFTELANALWQIFASGAEARNELLGLWKELGGRADLIRAIENALFNVVYALEPVRQAFETVFPPITAERLKELTSGFADLVERARFGTDTFLSIRSIFTGLFSILKVGVNTVLALVKGFTPLFNVLAKGVKIVVKLAGIIGDFFTAFSNRLDELGFFAELSAAIEQALGSLFGTIGKGISILVAFGARIASLVKLNTTVDRTSTLVAKVNNNMAKFHPVAYAVSKIVLTLTDVFSKLSTTATKMATKLTSGFGSIAEKLKQIKGSHEVFDKLRETFGVLTPVINAVEKAFNAVINAIRNWPETIQRVRHGFELLVHAFSVSISSVKKWLSNVKGIPDALIKMKEALGKFIDDLKQIKQFDEFGDKIDALKSHILTFIRDIKDSLSNYSPASVLTFVFGTAIVVAILNISKLVKKLQGLVDSATGVTKGITTMFNNIANSFKASVFIQMATSFTILAAALTMLASMPVQNILAAGTALTILGIEMIGLMEVFAAIQKTGAIKATNGFAASMALLGLGIAALAGSLKILDTIEIDKGLAARIGVLTLLMGELVAASVALARFAPALSTGAIFFVGFAVAITSIANALYKLGGIDVSNMESNIQALTQLIMDVSLLAFAASKIKFTSSAAILALIFSISLIVKAFKLIDTDLDYDKLESNFKEITVVFGTLLGLELSLGALGRFGGDAQGAGIGVLALVTSIFLIVEALKKIETLDFDAMATQSFMNNLAVVFLVLGSLVVTEVAMSVMLQQAGPASLKAIVGIAAMVGVMYAIVNLMKAIMLIEDKEALNSAIGIMALVVVLASGLSLASAATKNAKAGPIIAMIVAVGVIIAGLALLTYVDMQGLANASGALSATLLALAAAFWGMSKLTEKIKMSSIIGMVIMVGELTAALAILGNYNFGQMLAAGIALGACLVALGGALKLANNTGGFKEAATLLVMVAPILALGYSLSQIAQYPWEQIVAAGSMLSVTMIALAAAANIANSAIVGSLAMAIIAADTILMANAFTILSQVNFSALLPNLLALGGALTALVVLGAISGIPLVTAGLIALSAALLSIGVAAALFGVGAVLIGTGINLIATAFDTLTNALIRLGSLGPQQIQAIHDALAAMVSGVLDGLAASITKFAGTLVKGIVSTFTKMIATITSFIGRFVSAGASLLGAIVQGLSSRVKDAIAVVANCISTAYAKVKGAVGNFLSAAKQISNSILVGFKSKVSSAVNVIKTMVKNAVQSIKDKIKDFYNAAVDAVQGFINGIRKKIDDVKTAASEFANGFLNKFREITGWHSPWDTLIKAGKDAVAGIKRGIDSAKDSAFTSAAELGNGIANNIKAPISDTINQLNAAGIDTSGLEALVDTFGKAGDAAEDTGDKVGDEGDAAEEAAKQNEALAKALGGGGGGGGGGVGGAAEEAKDPIEELTEAISGQMDVFGKYENKVGTTGATMIKNISSWSSGIEGWSKRIEYLADQGINKGILQKLIDMGPSGVDAVNAFVSMTAEELAQAGEAYEAAIIAPAESAKRVLSVYGETSLQAAEVTGQALEANKELVESTTAATEATEAQLQRAQFAYENMRDSLKDIINSQMDIFSEFSTESDVTSETLINNMGSQLSGIKSWASNITELADKGINEGLLAQLRDMGPKGLAYVQAFNQMTSEELANYNDMYAESMTIADTTAAQIAESFATAGSNASIGFKNGIAQYNANAEAASLGDAAWVNLCVSLAEHSPSAKTYEAGMNFVLGFANGVTGYAPQANAAVTTFGYGVIEFLQTTLNAERFKEIGDSIGTGLEQGISESLERVKTMIEGAGFAESFVAIGASLVTSISTGISSATETVNAAIVTLVSNISISLANQNGVFMAAGTSLMTSLNTGMSSMSGALNSTGTSLMNSVVTTLNGFQFKYQDSGHKLIEKVIQGFKDRLNQLVNMAKQLATQANKTISDFQPQFLQTGQDLIDRLIDGFNNKESTVVDTSNKIGTSAQNAFNSQYDGFFRCGQYMIEGLDRGISSMENVIFEHLRRIAEEALDAAEEELEVESPSKKFFRLGRFVMMGWINGIDDLADRVPESLSGVANKSVRTVADAIAKVGKVASGELNLDPTIRPVLDLSGIRSGIGEMDSIFDARRSIDLAVNGIDTEAMNRTKPLVIYLNNTTTLDGEPIAQSVNKILGEAL